MATAWPRASITATYYLLTRTGLDWSPKYPAIADAVTELPVGTAYLDGELCGVLPDGRTAFNLIQNAADTRTGSLVFFLFDLLFLDGADLRPLPLIERKDRLKALLGDAPSCRQFTDHQLGRGPAFHRLACEHGLEGIVSKRVNGPYEPGRRTWLKTKCLIGDERDNRSVKGPAFEGSRMARANCRSRRS